MYYDYYDFKLEYLIISFEFDTNYVLWVLQIFSKTEF